MKITRIIVFTERHFEEVIACVCLSLIAIFVFMQVVLRYGFNTALTWTEELSGFAMAWTVYMGASLAVRERFHIRILIGVTSLPKHMSLIVILFADLTWFLFNVFMIRVGIEYLQVMWIHTTLSPVLDINEFWPQSVVVIGYLLISVRLMQIYVQWFRAGRKGLPGIPPEFDNNPKEAKG